MNSQTFKKLVSGASLSILLSISFTSANAASNIDVKEFDGYKIHTYYGVSNSHIIETGKGLYMVDGQMKISQAKDLEKYIKTLGKPLNKLILSHNHPDHWFGATVFKGKTDIVTSKNVIKGLKDRGAFYIKAMKKKLKDDAPNSVIVPDHTIALGEHDFDGLKVIIEEYEEHEAHHSLLIRIPELGVLIGQDLIYNNTFLVASERSRNQHWIKLLTSFEQRFAKDYPILLTGHGKNGGTELYQQNITYLKALEGVMQEGLSKDETTAKMIKLFPNRGAKGYLAISMRNLFSPKH